MFLLDGISYLWKCIFGNEVDYDEELLETDLLYQQMVDEEIMELEISERLIEMMLEQYKEGSSST